MSNKNKKSIFRNLRERDLIYMVKKASLLNELKNNKINLKSINNKGHWYYLW